MVFRTLTLLFITVTLGCSTDTENITQDTAKQDNWTISGFVKADSINPILQPSADQIFQCPISGEQIKWEERNVLNPSAVVKDEKVHLFYRAQDLSGTSRIGMAISEDGLHFEKSPTPVFYPDNDTMKTYEWNYRKATEEVDLTDCPTCYFDGVEDPRMVESADGKYIMTYTSYDGKTARLCLATSENLLTWVKHGPVLKSEKYIDQWSKSGAIISRLKGNKMIAEKINGKYHMYFGDTKLFMATSEDLINWEAVENSESKKLIEVLNPRPGFFDSRLVEPGPNAIIQDDGILLIYNASNAANCNDPNLPIFTYAAGQALYDINAPHKLIDRTDSYFIYPDKVYEKEGEVNEVCFVEGLVWFKDKWFLYYGTADSKIAVAVSEGL